MKVVIAIDSLKGSLSSMEAGRAIEQGILNVLPDTEVTGKPRPRLIRWQMAGKGQCGHWPRDLGEAWRM